MELYQSGLITFTVTATAILLGRGWAGRIGLVDRPHRRQGQGDDIPLIGGLALSCGLFSGLVSLGASVHNLSSFVVGGLCLLAVGVLDDLRGLSPGSRLFAQIVAALVMTVSGGVIVRDLGVLGFDDAPLSLGPMAIPFTVFGAVGVINAVNLSDGIDGLCGTLALVALLGLGIVSYASGLHAQLQLVLLLSCATVAFLIFNMRTRWRHRASVFLGDAGSMFLGFAVVWLLVDLSQGSPSAMSPVTALWFLAVPLFDTFGVIGRRIFKGRSPFHADHEHLHHLLLSAGFSVGQTVTAISSVGLVGMVFGLVGLYLGVAEHLMLLCFVAAFGCYFAAMMYAWEVNRLLGRPLLRGSVLRGLRV